MLNVLKKIHIPLLIIFSILFLLSSYIPNFYEISVKNLLPPDRVMLSGEHIYTYDYNVYLSKMKQGQEGRWSVVDKYDNDPQQKGVLLQMLYLLSGKIGGLFHLTPPITFHALRSILSLAWVLTIIYINIYFLKKPILYSLGIVLSLLAASFPVFYEYQGSTWIGMYMSWWTEMDVLKRISYLPHYTLNYIIVAVLFILLYKFSESQIQMSNQAQNPKSKEKNKLFGFWNWDFIAICIILFFSFFIHPAGSILFLFSWLIFWLITFIQFPISTFPLLPKIIFQTVILFLLALIPLLYINAATSSYPWKSLVDFDKYYRYPVVVKDYILTLGPVFFLGVGGIALSLLKKEKRLLPLISWVLAAFFGLFLFKKLPFQSELRFVQTANHIPLAILSAYFLYGIYSFFWNKYKKIPFVIIFINFFIYLAVLLIVTLGVAQSYFSIKSQLDFIHQRAVATVPLVPYPSQVMYPLKDYWNGIQWLDINTKNEDVVLSQVNAGNYIPAYAGNFVYIGHNPETPFYDERFNNVNQFFSGTMSNKDATEFLKREKISYIFYGPQEQEKSEENIKKYSFLQSSYISPLVTIYKVK